MVSLSALVLSAGLAAVSNVLLATASPTSSDASHFPGGAVSKPTVQRSQQKGRPVGHSGPPVAVQRDGSLHSSEYGVHGGGYSSGGPTGHGYSTGGYSGYPNDDYGYTEAAAYESAGGGLLGGIGKYGLIIIPILLGVTLLFLFPSVINIAGTGRDNRAIGGQGDPSDDLLQRAMAIYRSVSEDPVCVNRLFCELGSTLGQTAFANTTLRYMEHFLPAKSDNLLVLRRAARANDARCHVLACEAWEDKGEPSRDGQAGKRADSPSKETASRRQQRM